jgi:hypothetical protein
MRFTIVPIALLAPLAVACAVGSHPGSSSSSALYPDVATFSAARAQLECTTVGVTKCGAKDASACEATRTSLCEASQPQGTTYVPEHAQACIDLVTQITSAGTLTSAQEQSLATTCGSQIFSGPGAVRAPCKVDYDCSSKDGLVCIIPMNETSGMCLKPNPIAPAGACPGEADVCSDGYYCDPKSRTCITYAQQGEDCRDGLRPCAPGLRCPNSPFASGCAPLGSNGAACQNDTDCQALLCDKAIGQQMGTCTDAISFSSLDSVCANFK